MLDGVLGLIGGEIAGPAPSGGMVHGNRGHPDLQARVARDNHGEIGNRRGPHHGGKVHSPEAHLLSVGEETHGTRGHHHGEFGSPRGASCLIQSQDTP